MAEEHTAECTSHKDAMSWEYEYKCDCGVEDRMEITQLKADLAKHGGHTAMCPASERGRVTGMKNCDPKVCGWAEIEKGQE